eukprot:COSAG05_NODE_385_length_10486_cov_12.944835_13_plen_61_part_00
MQALEDLKSLTRKEKKAAKLALAAAEEQLEEAKARAVRTALATAQATLAAATRARQVRLL